jgi:hypothetical protein
MLRATEPNVLTNLPCCLMPQKSHRRTFSLLWRVVTEILLYWQQVVKTFRASQNLRRTGPEIPLE